MQPIAQFLRTTILGGLFFLVPIVVLIVIPAKAFDYAKKVLNAVFGYIPAAADLTAGAATLLAVALVALVCVLAGLLAHTVTAHRLIDALQSSLLSKIPAYDYLKQESARRLGRRRDRKPPRSLRAHGRRMAARRSNRSAEQRPRLHLRSWRARPAFRVGLLLSDGPRSTCWRQAGRYTQPPQAMRRGRIRARRQVAGRGVAPPDCQVGSHPNIL